MLGGLTFEFISKAIQNETFGLVRVENCPQRTSGDYGVGVKQKMGFIFITAIILCIKFKEAQFTRRLLSRVLANLVLHTAVLNAAESSVN